MSKQDDELRDILQVLCRDTTLVYKHAEGATTATAVSDADKAYKWMIDKALIYISTHYIPKAEVLRAINVCKQELDHCTDDMVIYPDQLTEALGLTSKETEE